MDSLKRHVEQVRTRGLTRLLAAHFLPLLHSSHPLSVAISPSPPPPILSPPTLSPFSLPSPLAPSTPQVAALIVLGVLFGLCCFCILLCLIARRLFGISINPTELKSAVAELRSVVEHRRMRRGGERLRDDVGEGTGAGNGSSRGAGVSMGVSIATRAARLSSSGSKTVESADVAADVMAEEGMEDEEAAPQTGSQVKRGAGEVVEAQQANGNGVSATMHALELQAKELVE